MKLIIPAMFAVSVACAGLIAGFAPADPEIGQETVKRLQTPTQTASRDGTGDSDLEAKGARSSVIYRAGGTPPWAPPQGYRQVGGDPDYYTQIYQPPFGIAVGHCDNDVLGGLLQTSGAKHPGPASGRIAILGGTASSALVGGPIGRSMDQVDLTCVGQALEHASSGETVTWTGSKHLYFMRLLNAFQNTSGQYCRDYTTSATIGGDTSNLRGSACRAADGSWYKMG